MADDDPNRIDPRYDPAFQRGYRGEVRSVEHGESALRRAAVVSSAPARAAASMSAGAPALGDARPESAGASLPTEPAAVSIVETARASDPASGPPPTPAPVEDAYPGTEPATARDVTRNPFHLAAAALAVLLIVGGAVWLNQGFAAIADDRAATTVGYYAAMTMAFGAPLMIGIGVAIVAGLLFVLARGWRPRDAERR